MDINNNIFEEFNQTITNAPSVEELLSVSVNTYNNIVGSEYSAIYLFDKTTFEPILKTESEKSNNSNKSEYLEYIIDKGLIGDIMNSNQLIEEKYTNSEIALLPLISSQGALGFVLLSKSTEFQFEENTKIILNLFSGYLASTIDSLIIKNEGNYYKNKIDQLAAIQTRELLNTKKEISEKVEQLKSSLLMTLPHEVRTPLNQILGLTDYLKNSIDDTEKDEMEEILEDVHSSAVRLRRLFENYLYLSTLTINSYDIEQLEELQKSAIYSAESLIIEAATNLAYTNNQKDSIEMELEDSPLQISEEHFNKLIYELVDNSFKFSNDDRKISIKSDLVGDKYKIEIEDNGIGMPIEKIHMLDAYIQFDRLANEQQGSGLGLAIVKKILTIYKGEIKFESEIDNFTRITLFLPTANLDDLDI